jgi:TonB-linked SusC/RagA family outer membrane protein
MRKITILLTFLFLVGMQLTYAQTRTINGTVTSSDNGEALPGVTVQLKGTTVGTITDFNGKYSLSVDLGQGNVLLFSYVGMATQEIPIGSSNTINVVLKPSALAISEVVVTAMGVSREKKSLGYAVQEVSNEDLTRAKDPNVINSLAGKVAGVSVRNSTNLGGSSNILIRGSSSLTGDNQPLFIVDGVPLSNYNSNADQQMQGRSGYDYGSPVDDIDPNDIESVSVLKSGAATALYGSRAANGVILITTKKGSKTEGTEAKRFHVTFDHSTMFHQMDKSTFPKYQQNYGEGYGPFYSGPLGDGEPSDYPGLYHYDFNGDGQLDYVEPTTEDASMGSHFDPNLMVYKWNSFYPELPTYNQKSPYVVGANGPDYFFKTGHTVTNSLSVTSGTEHSTFRLSYTNLSETGIMPNSKLNKNSLDFSGSVDIVDNITISADVNYVNTSTVGRNHTGYSDNIMSSFRQWFNLGVDVKQLDDFYHLTGKNISWNPNSEFNTYPIYWDNPYWQRWENYQSDDRDRVFGNVALSWDIVEGLNFTARYSLDHFNFLQEERKAVGSVSGEFGTGSPRQQVTSGYARRTIGYTETDFDAMLKYNKYLTDDLSLDVLLGTNIMRNKLDNVFAATNGGLAVPGTYSLNNSAAPMLPPEESLQKVGVNGYYANLTLGFKSMLFLEGTYRYDISSTLPEDNRAYGYYGASLGFVFSELIDAHG